MKYTSETWICVPSSNLVDIVRQRTVNRRHEKSFFSLSWRPQVLSAVIDLGSSCVVLSNRFACILDPQLIRLCEAKSSFWQKSFRITIGLLPKTTPTCTTQLLLSCRVAIFFRWNRKMHELFWAPLPVEHLNFSMKCLTVWTLTNSWSKKSGPQKGVFPGLAVCRLFGPLSLFWQMKLGFVSETSSLWITGRNAGPGI